MVYHILKDGSRPSDITGRVVKEQDAPALYELIHRMNDERKRIQPTQSKENSK